MSGIKEDGHKDRNKDTQKIVNDRQRCEIVMKIRKTGTKTSIRYTGAQPDDSIRRWSMD